MVRHLKAIGEHGLAGQIDDLKLAALKVLHRSPSY
jgi:hypothetical protein